MNRIYSTQNNQPALPQHGKRNTMMQIYYADGVNPSTCQHTCSTLKEAKKWINEQIKGYKLVDADHLCTENVLESSRTALYEVYDGEPVTTGENGAPIFAEPVYESDYFYTE